MRRPALFIIFLCATAMPVCQVFARSPAAGKIVLVTGQAAAVSADGKTRILKPGEAFYEGDTIETQKKSQVRLKYTDGGRMLLRPTTKMIVEKYRDPRSGVGESVTKLVKGGLRAVTGEIAKRNQDNYILKTPAATMTVRGTDYTVRYCQGDCTDLEIYGAPAPDNGLYTGVSKGGIVLTNDGGSQVFKVGQYAYIARFNARPRLLPTAPAIFVIDNLPDPKASSSDDFVKTNACR